MVPRVKPVVLPVSFGLLRSVRALPGFCALSALRLSVLGGFAWSMVSSADLHVVENTFD